MPLRVRKYCGMHLIRLTVWNSANGTESSWYGMSLVIDARAGIGVVAASGACYFCSSAYRAGVRNPRIWHVGHFTATRIRLAARAPPPLLIGFEDLGQFWAI